MANKSKGNRRSRAKALLVPYLLEEAEGSSTFPIDCPITGGHRAVVDLDKWTWACLEHTREAVWNGSDVAFAFEPQPLGELLKQVREIRSMRQQRGQELSAGAVLDDDTVKQWDWIITNLVERMDRITLTGGEGDGKTLWQQQFGVKAAAGIHPVADVAMQPVSVLYVDLENGYRRTKRELAKLFDQLDPEQQDAARKHYHLVNWIEGLVLSEAEDQQRLLDLCATVQPDLLFVGPRYKMVANELSPDEAATVQKFLDRLRTRFGCAIVTEAHMPYGQEHSRTTREYGPSSWMRWPEFGLHLRRSGEMVYFRPPREAFGRQWCNWQRNDKAWERGTGWPWLPIASEGGLVVDAYVGGELSSEEVAIALQALTNKPEVTFKDWCREMRDLGMNNTDRQAEAVHECRINGWVDHQVEGIPKEEKPGPGKRQKNVLTEAGIARLKELKDG